MTSVPDPADAWDQYYQQQEDAAMGEALYEAAPDLLEIVEGLLVKPGPFTPQWYLGHAAGCPPSGYSKDHPAGSWECNEGCKKITAALTKAGRVPDRITKGYGPGYERYA